MTKRLVDIDDDALRLARRQLGTTTIKDTVNTALARAVGDRATEVKRALDILAEAQLESREDAWR